MPRGRELVAVILALGAGLSLLALSMGAAFEIADRSGHLSDHAAAVLSTALGAAIGAVAANVGGGRGE